MCAGLCRLPITKTKTPSMSHHSPSPMSEEEIVKEHLRLLRTANPTFFEDPKLVKLVGIILVKLRSEFSKHHPIEQVGMVAAIMSLMYGMGNAAIKSVQGFAGDDMTEIFINEYADHRHTDHPGN
jgi:hypothetical protein